MFGINTIKGQKEFANAQGKMKITSIFFTLQGEGPFRGLPALFVRTTHCNLACSFCDAFFEEGEWYTPEEIMGLASQEITKYFKGDVPKWASGEYQPRKMVFVVTGGEPTLQNDTLYELLQRAVSEYKWTQIESNGVLEPKVPDSTIVVISPKCNEKVNLTDGFKRYIPTKYMEPNRHSLARADVLKFIVEDQPDFDSPYQTVPQWAHDWHKVTGRDIYISPMNIYQREPIKATEARQARLQGEATLAERSLYDEVVSAWEPGLLDMAANQRNHEYAGKYALDHGFIFQMQLHLYCSMA